MLWVSGFKSTTARFVKASDKENMINRHRKVFCEGNPPFTGGFPSQRASAVEWVIMNILVTCDIFFSVMSLHYALIPGNSFAQYISNDTLDHRSRRLQRQVDLKNQSLPHGDEITSEHGPDKQYELAKTFPPLHGDEWHVFRDNVQKLGELGADDFVTLKAKARSVEYCNPSSYPVKGTEGKFPSW